MMLAIDPVGGYAWADTGGQEAYSYSIPRSH
jgi:hypothetical protein